MESSRATGSRKDGTAWFSSQALLSAKLSSALVGVSLRTWWRLDSSGKIPAAVRVGKAKRWRTQELEDWIAAGCPDRAKWEATARSTAKKKG
jgi:predicted DNA-binding transcriptional regulator AlpA